MNVALQFDSTWSFSSHSSVLLLLFAVSHGTPSSHTFAHAGHKEKMMKQCTMKQQKIRKSLNLLVVTNQVGGSILEMNKKS